MNAKKQLQTIVIVGFLGNLALTVGSGVSFVFGSKLGMAILLSLAIPANYLYFRYLWVSLNRKVFEPWQSLASSPAFEKAGVYSDFGEQANDISARLLEDREKERMIADHAIEVICSLDKDLKLLAVNPAVYKHWGYPPGGIIGKDFLKYVYADDREGFKQNLDVCKSQGNINFESRIVASEGQVIDLAWSIEWSESFSVYFCAARDISDRKNLERAKQEFISMISHDLRSPLSSVYLFIQSFKTHAGNPQIQAISESRPWRSAMMSMSRVLSLLDQLLDYDRAEAGELVLNLKPVSVAEIFAHSIPSVEALATHKGVTIETEPTQTEVVADRDRIVQVLVNLVANAIKFTDSGKKIRLYVSEAPDHLIFHVEDQGRGIPLEAQKTIFERFKQVSKKDAATGSGLGLPISKLLVESHRSTLILQSEVGKGSTFSFRLPRA